MHYFLRWPIRKVERNVKYLFIYDEKVVFLMDGLSMIIYFEIWEVVETFLN